MGWGGGGGGGGFGGGGGGVWGLGSGVMGEGCGVRGERRGVRGAGLAVSGLGCAVRVCQRWRAHGMCNLISEPIAICRVFQGFQLFRYEKICCLIDKTEADNGINHQILCCVQSVHSVHTGRAISAHATTPR